MIDVHVNNYMMTEKEASERKCPYIKDKFGYPIYCNSDCMSWIQARKKIEREDHSGAEHVIREEARKRNYQEIKRKGPPGCTGYLYLEAQGFCLRLWKEAS